eukprot:g16959.t1
MCSEPGPAVRPQVLWTEKAQQPQSDPATLPPAELLHPQPAPAHPPPSPECDRPSAAELISKEALGKKVTVAFVLLGKRRNYFKKFPIEELNLEDRKLYPVEKAEGFAFRCTPHKARDPCMVRETMSCILPSEMPGLQKCLGIRGCDEHYDAAFAEPLHRVPATSGLQPFALHAAYHVEVESGLRVEALRFPSPMACGGPTLDAKQLRAAQQARLPGLPATGEFGHDRRHNSQGVRLLKPEEAQTFAQTCSTNQTRRPRGMVQQYLANPLLVNGHKCDFRVYLYIPTSVPLVAFYSSAWYMKCGHQQFNLSSTDPENVVTNTKVHGKLREGANYSQLVLGPKQVQDVLGPKLGPAHKDFVQVELDAKIKQKLGLLMEVMESQAEDLQTTGYELLGCDMMLDADLNLWLIEVNNSPELMPSLGARQKAVDHILPAVVKSQPEEPVESEGLQMVCRKLPVLERHSSTQFVQAVNTAINRMGSKFGLCDLVDEEEEPDDVGPQKLGRLEILLATTPSQLNHLAQNPNPKRMMRRRSLDLEAAEAWDQAISKRGLGETWRIGSDKLPLRGDSKGSGSPPGSPLGGPTMRELDQDKLQESSQTRASILDFEHLFVQYFVEVTPLKQSKEFSGTHREWLAQPKADAVVKAWKEVLVEGLLARKELILQHWPELQLNKESLYSKLNKELLVQERILCRWELGAANEDELAGPKRRVLLTLAPEQVCHRLLWALGDSIPAELGLKDCAARLQERFPQSRIRCSDRPSSAMGVVGQNWECQKLVG